MPKIPYEPEIIAAIIILILIFVRPIRLIVSILVRIAILIAAIVIVIGGVSMLLNDETIFDQPGVEARTIRFFTQKEAATSEKGIGSATCTWPGQVVPAVKPATVEPVRRDPDRREAGRHREKTAANPTPAAAPTNSGGGVYPELVAPSYPGIPREKIFQISLKVVNSLGGWKIVNSDPRTGIIDCVYTSRILGLEDDIRITVTPKSEVQICSRSGSARPGSTSILRFFPGDFGANVGHIKQFTETIDPMMDQVYAIEQQKENAKKPPGMP